MKNRLYLILGIAALMAGVITPTSYAMPEPYTHETASQTVKLKVHGHQLEIVNCDTEDKTVVIYALTGQIVKHFDAQPGSTVVDLNAGCYIVRIDRLSQRIIIR